MDVDVDNLVREAERLIAEVESSGFEPWCRQMGLDCDKVRAMLLGGAFPESGRRAREIFDEDMAEVSREVEARASELGIIRHTDSPKASVARQNRRMRMV